MKFDARILDVIVEKWLSPTTKAERSETVLVVRDLDEKSGVYDSIQVSVDGEDVNKGGGPAGLAGKVATINVRQLIATKFGRARLKGSFSVVK